MRTCARGSVLMLMPAGLLIVFVLGSISIEFAAVSMRQRALYNVADAAANSMPMLTHSLSLALRSGGTHPLIRPPAARACSRRRFPCGHSFARRHRRAVV